MVDREEQFAYGRARRPAPNVRDPLLQWATGLETARARQVYAGWFSEAGVNAPLDEAMRAAGMAQVTIKHRESGPRTHWAIEVADVFVLATGVQSIQEMSNTAERYGIAFGWGATPQGRLDSKLRARVLLRPLLAVGYSTPFTLTISGPLTAYMLDALACQFEVLDAAEALAQRHRGAPVEYPFYAFSLPLGAGENVDVGKVDRKSVAPPVAVIPTPITEAYLVEHTARPYRATIEALIEPTLRWSVAESQRLQTQPVREGVPANGHAAGDEGDFPL